MYEYEKEKAWVFTEDGQVMFLRIRDNAGRLIKQAGAARMDKIMAGCTGDSWHMLACIDRLVELGELREVKQEGVPGQHRVFVSAKEEH